MRCTPRGSFNTLSAMRGTGTSACLTTMTSRKQMTEENKTMSSIPDLMTVPLENLEDLGANVLAEAIRLYRSKVDDSDVLCSFNATIR
jgi:hypothetical protein